MQTNTTLTMSMESRTKHSQTTTFITL